MRKRVQPINEAGVCNICVVLHTHLLQKLIALIKNKELEGLEVQITILDQLQNTARSTDDNVGGVGLELLLVRGDRHTAKEHGSLDVAHVLFEAVELLADLVCQLTSVAKNESLDFAGNRVDLVQGGQNEHGRLTHTTLCLAKNIVTENGLRNALVLHYESTSSIHGKIGVCNTHTYTYTHTERERQIEDHTERWMVQGRG
jgi:hypothetical protein